MAPNAISYTEILIPSGPCRHPHSPADHLAPTTQRLLATARQLSELAARRLPRSEMYAVDIAGSFSSGLDSIRRVSACRCCGASMRDGSDEVSFLGLEASGYCC
jgi:hypothetical protein